MCGIFCTIWRATGLALQRSHCAAGGSSARGSSRAGCLKEALSLNLRLDVSAVAHGHCTAPTSVATSQNCSFMPSTTSLKYDRQTTSHFIVVLSTIPFPAMFASLRSLHASHLLLKLLRLLGPVLTGSKPKKPCLPPISD